MVSPSPTPFAVSRQHDLVARRLVLGLLVDAPADLDVEHVDLAVARAQLAVGADVDRRVAAALVALDALAERAGDEVDAELARRCRAPTAGPARRTARRPRSSAPACRARATSPGSTTSSAPADAAARVSRSAVSRLRSRSGVDCSWTAAARTRALLPRRTDPSVNRAYRSAPWHFGSHGDGSARSGRTRCCASGTRASACCAARGGRCGTASGCTRARATGST